MDRIAALIQDALASDLGSAAAVSVGDGGRQVFSWAGGHVRRVPDRGAAIDERTPFDVASLTKPMCTVACAMVLVARGALDLDAPLRRWLADAASAGTVRQLLGHAAGCAAHVEFFRRLRAEQPAEPYARLVELAMREPCEAPGMAAVYSDLGFLQLGAIVERAGGARLDDLFRSEIAGPLGLSARFAPEPVVGAVATELDDRGLVCGLVHDENAYHGGRICGHAGLFASIADVATFASAIVSARAPFDAATLERFFTDAPTASTWRLGWDTPSATPGVSQAGDAWPRTGAAGHTGFTGTCLWLDLPRRRWVALLTNRVHPTRHGATADRIKALRRAVNDAAVAILGG